MSNIPSKIQEALNYNTQHQAIWSGTGVAAQIGLTDTQLQQLKAYSMAAQAKFTAANNARLASKVATTEQNEALRNARNYCQDLIDTIKAYAQTNNNVNVYNIAQIEPPAPPTPAGAPVAPTNVVADPNRDGTITIKWKGSTANQTFFSVWRQVGTGTFTQIGSTASKKFDDVNVPSGVNSINYVVKSQRGNDVSPPSNNSTVVFGTGSGPGEVAGFVGGTSAKSKAA